MSDFNEAIPANMNELTNKAMSHDEGETPSYQTKPSAEAEAVSDMSCVDAEAGACADADLLCPSTEPDTNTCCCRKKVRSEKEYKDLMNRLSRIEGQIRGLKRMLDEDAYCIDIINQVSAANCALNSFTKVILANHIKSCVADDVKEGNDEKLDELVKTLQKLMK